ncbi:MAG: Gldg family protein, partial [Anaerolineae bacterium]|nr:Gldg family protein [Anaerolineae bacterium]
PDSMQDAPETIQKVADEISGLSNGKFVYEAVDVSDPANRVDTDVLATQFGITPIAESFFAEATYYLHMVLVAGSKTQVIYPGVEVSESEIRSNIEGALQRASSGFLKVVGLWTPPNIPTQDAFGQMVQSFQQFLTVGQVLGEDYEVQSVDLASGQVPVTLDVLFVIAPQNMTDLERYAVDQYLMRGGTVFVAAGNYQLGPDPFTGQIALQPIQGGLQDMLTDYGITVEPSLVLDRQNTPFPTTVTQNVGGVAVQQIQAIEYPLFVNVRQDGFNEDSPIFAQLPAITLNWASPLTIDEAKTDDAKVTVLMKSSDEAWTTTDLNIQPDLTTYPNFGFPTQGDAKSYPLAVVIEGSFQSFFKDKPSPFGEVAPAEGQTTTIP